MLAVGILALSLDNQADELVDTNQELNTTITKLDETNDALEISRTTLISLNVALKEESDSAEAARLESRSLILAAQSRDTSPPEDRLLLARAAISSANTLAARNRRQPRWPADSDRG